MSIDPVCGMTVDEKRAAGKEVYKGKTYLFCSAACHQAFKKNPEKFVK
jgi:YHS domain-containing protein